MPDIDTINPYDFLILILTASMDCNRVRGRTTLQKIGYFATNYLKIENDYIPHFYGPFSSTLAIALKRLVELRLVEEEFEITTNDRKIYTYSLTKKGKDYSKELVESRGRQFVRIKKIVEKIKTLRGNRIENLSYAAKIHYLTRGKKMSVPAIRDKAKSFGWNISENRIESSILWLKRPG